MLGINSASEFSLKEKFLNLKEHNLIIKHIYAIDKSLNLKNYFSRKDVSKLLEFMKNDKKNNSNKINLILIKKIGNVTYNNFFDLNKISKFIRLQFYNM